MTFDHWNFIIYEAVMRTRHTKRAPIVKLISIDPTKKGPS